MVHVFKKSLWHVEDVCVCAPMSVYQPGSFFKYLNFMVCGSRGNEGLSGCKCFGKPLTAPLPTRLDHERQGRGNLWNKCAEYFRVENQASKILVKTK
jgi:hypothetical protein